MPQHRLGLPHSPEKTSISDIHYLTHTAEQESICVMQHSFSIPSVLILYANPSAHSIWNVSPFRYALQQDALLVTAPR